MVQLLEETEAPRRGRPRRFSSHTERQLLLDAAVRVMSENGYDGTSVNDVLEEAGLSTRAFYRQFDSKQALLTALIERERDRVAFHLEKAAKSADDPLAAVEAWIDAFLDLLYNPEIARRRPSSPRRRFWPPTRSPPPCPRCSACSAPR